jgi:pimeloyl-ACP methyl ester carboxylesterase/DNA-binding SARP family transcriptional activator
MVQNTDSLLHLELFGLPSIGLGCQRLHLSPKRAYALLAFLALEGRRVSRDHLSALLWADVPAPVAHARLRRLIYQIKEVCGSDLFESYEGGIALARRALRCDAVEFHRMAHALIARTAPGDPQADIEALTVAACEPLMDGLACDSQAFDDWVHLQKMEHQHLLTRVLVRLAERQRKQGRRDEAAATAERLLGIDRYSEPAYVLRMALAADARDAAGVDAVFTRCADALRAEFGTKPGAFTERAFVESRARAELSTQPQSECAGDDDAAIDVRFATGADGPVAYATFGHGPQALVLVPGFVTHMEIAWEHPGIRDVVARLAQRFTVIVFDRRGVGLSERMGAVSTIASTAADVLAILDVTGIRRAWLFGSSEGGPAAIRLAALHGDRVAGLVLFGTMARGSRDADYPWALRREDFDTWMRKLIAGWGGPADIETFAPTLQADPATRTWWARMLRHAATPASLRTVLTGLREADVRDLLPQVACPTLVMHRRGDRAVRFQAGEHLAANIPAARFLPMPGECHWWWVENPGLVALAILDFASAGLATPDFTVLAGCRKGT